MDPFSREQAKPTPPVKGEPGARQRENTKGSTKTVSRRKSFKRRPRK